MAETLSFWERGIDDAERARRMVAAARLVGDLPSETYRRDQDLRNVRLYENNSSISLYDYAGRYYADSINVAMPAPEQSKNNRAKAAIDTFASQVFTTDQRARFRVVDGSYRQRRRARELQNFTDGLVHELKLHQLKKRAGKDAAIFESGVGVIQVYREKRKDGDRCAAQRVLPTELSFDPKDGLVDGVPRTLYRWRPIARDKVLADFGDGDDGELTKLIKAARPCRSSSGVTEELEVFEAETLPSGDGADDGWHIVALDTPGPALVAEPYTKPYHSFVFFAVEERTTTGWGLSLMHQARDLQIGINANVYRADRIRKLFAAGHLYVNKMASVEKSKLSNEIGSVWEGNAPAAEAMSFIQFTGATADIDAAIERDGQRIFDNLGINVGASTGDTSRGLGASAAAMREETQKTDRRNSERQQRWEQFHLDIVRAALGVVRDIVGKDGGKSYKVGLPERRGLTVVDWKQASMDEKSYVLDVRPASPVPTDPAGLMAFGKDMVDMGAWTPQQLAGFMQDLDADGRVNRQLAQERRLEKTFESLLYDKAASAAPDEFTNLQMALDIGTEYLAQGEEDGVPEKHLERVRRYLKRCKSLASQAQASQQPAPGDAGQPGMTQGPGGTAVPPSGGPPQLSAVA